MAVAAKAAEENDKVMNAQSRKQLAAGDSTLSSNLLTMSQTRCRDGVANRIVFQTALPSA